MTLQIIRYPTDPTGENPDNAIVGEVHPLKSRPVRVVAPTYGPYFTKSLVIVDNATNLELVRGVHYRIAELLQSATVEFGQEVARLILITDEKVGPDVRINYQAVGGSYENDATNLINLYEAVLADNRPVDWVNVADKPDEYNPALHNHVLQEIYGFEYTVTALERIRNAIRLMKIPALNSFDDKVSDRINEINTKLVDTTTSNNDAVFDVNYLLNSHLTNLSNPHRVTKGQVGLGSVLNYPVATQAEAEAVNLHTRYMTPLRVKQAILQTIIVDLTTHSNDTSNPHRVTKAQVGLGSVANYPMATIAESIAGTSDSRYIDPAGVKSLIASRIDSNLSTHPARTDNPHGVTKTQVGLGDVQNYTLASQAEAEAGTLNNRYMTPQRTMQAITYYFTPILSGHESRTDNPHQVTKSLVGLGNLENYPIASQAEAEAGVATDRYMTPLRVKQAFLQLQGITVSWNDIPDKPTTFAPDAHTHQWSSLTDIPATYAPSTHTHVWNDITNKPVEFEPTAHVHPWTDFEGIPTTFIPTPHTHDFSTGVTGKPLTYPPMFHLHDWTAITGKPLTYTPESHSHSVDEINGLSGLSSVTVQGPTSMIINTTENFIITNYDAFLSYTISAVSGTIVNRVNETITYTAPNIAGPGGFIINGRQIDVTIALITPNTPSITSPTEGATGLSASPTFTSSVYSISDGSITHAASDWQISTDSNFSVIAQEVINSSINKTTWSASGLNPLTTYYARVRYKGSNGAYSAWSNPVSFTTANTQLAGTEQAYIVPATLVREGLMDAGAIDDTGTRVVLAASNVIDTVTNHGMWVFVRTGTSWALEKAFNLYDYTNYPNGFSVDIDATGTRIIVGTLENVLIFVRTGSVWELEVAISTLMTIPNTWYFGWSVVINGNGDRVIIGDPGGVTDSVAWSGRIYTFTRTGSVWTLEADIPSPVAQAQYNFGYSIEADDSFTRMVVGAPCHYTNTVGEAHVYVRSGSVWTKEVTVVSPDNDINDTFGYSVSIDSSGTRIAVGSPNYNPSTELAGTTPAVFVFTRSGTTWTQEAKLITTPYWKAFGESVKFNSAGSDLMIGAPGQIWASNTGDTGKTYVFTRSGSSWSLRLTLTSSVAETNNFGACVDMTPTGSYAMVLAPYSTGDYASNIPAGARGKAFILV